MGLINGQNQTESKDLGVPVAQIRGIVMESKLISCVSSGSMLCDLLDSSRSQFLRDASCQWRFFETPPELMTPHEDNMDRD